MKRLRVTGQREAGHDLAKCPYSTENHLYPGLHPNQGQQGEREDSALVLSSGESPPTVLHPPLGCSAQEGQGPAGARPREDHKGD